MKSKFRHVALIGKYQATSSGAAGASTRKYLDEVAHFLMDQGCEVVLEVDTATNIGLTNYTTMNAQGIGAHCDLCLVVGGDGTMLGIGRQLAPYKVPLIGINQGRLGFITDIALEQYRSVLAALSDPDEVIRVLREHKPDLVVLDLRMPASDGLTLLRRIRAEGIDTPALILTMSDSETDLSAALRAGVRGYLLKDMEPEDVVTAIGHAARGELTVAPAMTLKLAQLLQAGGQGRDRRGLLDSLTERERQILDHLARGESNKTIARALDISHDTVKLHVRHILSKLNLSSRVEAAVFAVVARSGIDRRP